MTRPLAWVRIGGLVAGIGALFALVAATGSFSADRVRDAVDPLGAAAPVAFIVFAALLVVAMFPLPPLAAASGLLFSTAAGTVTSLAGAVLGAVVAFSLSRRVAADAAGAVAGRRLLRARDWIDDRGFVAVLYTRIAPLPYSLMSYLAGLTRVGPAVFGVATGLGVAPRVYAYTALGGNLDNLQSPEAITAAILLVVMFGLGLAAMMRSTSRGVSR